MMDMQVLRWCAEEVEKQLDTAMHVLHMYSAWDWLYDANLKFDFTKLLTTNDVLILGFLVKPSNGMQFRQAEVTFPSGGSAAESIEVPRLMNRFCSHWVDMTAEEAYQQFEWIHPFNDGNGRTGALLFNLKNKTLGAPIAPPEYVHQGSLT